MFSTKQLTEEQIKSIKSWAAEGDNLSQIQAKMKEQLQLSVTYMDMRFVILDLGIELVQVKKEEPVQEISTEPVVHDGGVQVTMDSIPLPGAIVSGKAVFSDGEKATWTLDQSGRPGLDPATPDYQPSREDIVEFQTQLRALIEQSGL